METSFKPIMFNIASRVAHIKLGAVIRHNMVNQCNNSIDTVKAIGKNNYCYSYDIYFVIQTLICISFQQ